MNSRQLPILIGLALFLGAAWFFFGGAGFFSTPMSERRLMCSNTDCNNAFKAQLPVKFKDYPAKCPKCSQRSAFVLTRCWKCSAPYPLDLKHPLDKCPKCGCELPKY